MFCVCWLRACEERLEASTPCSQKARQMITDLNKAGLTAFGSAGCEAEGLPIDRGTGLHAAAAGSTLQKVK